jgi:excisionase family DNA binding protein
MKRDVVTVDELTKILPMSRPVIWKRIRNGEIPAFHLGRRIYVRLSELEQVMSAEQPADSYNITGLPSSLPDSGAVATAAAAGRGGRR